MSGITPIRRGMFIPDDMPYIVDAARRLRMPQSPTNVISGAKLIGKSISSLAAGQRETLINLVGDDEKANIVSVALDSFGAMSFAEVTWGTGGFFSTVQVDMNRGQVMSFNCSSIRVDAVNESTLNTTAKIAAFASMGPMTGQPASRPTRTIRTDIANAALTAIAPGATRFILQPNFARDVTLHRHPRNSYELEFLDETGALILYSIMVPNDGFPDTTEISNDCKLLRLRNTGAVNINFARPIFGIAI